MASSIQNATDLLNIANINYINENYEKAAENYGFSIELEPGLLDAFTGRAATYSKMGNHRAALQDANKAIQLDAKCEVAYFRKGQAAFSLEEFETAREAFEKGLKLYTAEGTDTRKYRTWIRKCEAEIEGSDNDDMVEDSSPNKNGKTSTPTPAPAAPPINTIKYQYYQTADQIVLSIMEKNCREEDFSLELQEDKIKVTVSRATGEAIVALDKTLYDQIIPDECTRKFGPIKVEIKLKKKTSYQWPTLEGDGRGGAGAPLSVPEEAAKKPKAYSSTRDWEKIETEIKKELEEEKPEGEAALNKLFSDIYANATEETRRAMNKSFQTSGGTVLSTNWDEVSKADYETERTAPEGMEWQTWEGKKLPQKKYPSREKR